MIEREKKRLERLAHKFQSGPPDGTEVGRPRISEEVRIEVWNRDDGRCRRCGSREKLEYDHIIPLSKGGSNTARNIELLCERCNRSKADDIE